MFIYLKIIIGKICEIFTLCDFRKWPLKSYQWPSSSLNARSTAQQSCAHPILKSFTVNRTIEHQTMFCCWRSLPGTGYVRTHRAMATVFARCCSKKTRAKWTGKRSNEWDGWHSVRTGFRSNCTYYFNITDNVQFPFLVTRYENAHETTEMKRSTVAPPTNGRPSSGFICLRIIFPYLFLFLLALVFLR